jgi:hypothetical protein
MGNLSCLALGSFRTSFWWSKSKLSWVGKKGVCWESRKHERTQESHHRTEYQGLPNGETSCQIAIVSCSHISVHKRFSCKQGRARVRSEADVREARPWSSSLREAHPEMGTRVPESHTWAWILGIISSPKLSSHGQRHHKDLGERSPHGGWQSSRGRRGSV